jgi:hypothetical protein
MSSVPVIEKKIVAMFEAAATLHGGFVGRRVIAAISRLVVSELDSVNSWAVQLTSPERMAEGAKSLRAWLEMKPHVSLPRWARLLARGRHRSLKFCDWLGKNAEKVSEELARIR